jgi:hypothetical protein
MPGQLLPKFFENVLSGAVQPSPVLDPDGSYLIEAEEF